MATESEIKKMRAAMEVCGVAPDLISQAIADVSNADFFNAPALLGMSRADANRFFDEKFWPEYPKRDGQNPKEPTRNLIIAALISGENPQAILAGLRRLAQDMARRHKIGTEFVPRAVTWARGKGWKDDPVTNCRPPNTGTNNGGMGFYAAAAHIRSQMDDEG